MFEYVFNLADGDALKSNPMGGDATKHIGVIVRLYGIEDSIDGLKTREIAGSVIDCLAMVDVRWQNRVRSKHKVHPLWHATRTEGSIRCVPVLRMSRAMSDQDGGRLFVVKQERVQLSHKSIGLRPVNDEGQIEIARSLAEHVNFLGFKHLQCRSELMEYRSDMTSNKAH